VEASPEARPQRPQAGLRPPRRRPPARGGSAAAAAAEAGGALGAVGSRAPICVQGPRGTGQQGAGTRDTKAGVLSPANTAFCPRAAFSVSAPFASPTIAQSVPPPLPGWTSAMCSSACTGQLSPLASCFGRKKNQQPRWCACDAGAFPRPGIHFPEGGPEQPRPQVRGGAVLLRQPLPPGREAHAAGAGPSLFGQGGCHH